MKKKKKKGLNFIFGLRPPKNLDRPASKKYIIRIFNLTYERENL